MNLSTYQCYERTSRYRTPCRAKILVERRSRFTHHSGEHLPGCLAFRLHQCFPLPEISSYAQSYKPVQFPTKLDCSTKITMKRFCSSIIFRTKVEIRNSEISLT